MYLFARTVTQLVVGLCLSVVLWWVYLYGMASPNTHCELYGRHYTCIVPLANFYATIVVAAMVAVHGFVIIALNKVVAHFFRRHLGDFARVMEASRKYVEDCIQR